MRLFIAGYPPAPAGDHLAAAVAPLDIGQAAARGVNARLASAATWHLTLAFLGEVPDDRANRAAGAVQAAATRWQATGGRPPRLRLAGGGRFGRGRFTLLWVGVRGDTAGLTAVSDAIRAGLRRAKVPFDRKPTRPHLTLARPGDRLDITDDLAALRTYEGPEWTLDELHLVRSHLGPAPRYDRLATIPLDAAGQDQPIP